MKMWQVILVALVVAVAAYFGLNYGRTKWAEMQAEKAVQAGAGGS